MKSSPNPLAPGRIEGRKGGQAGGGRAAVAREEEDAAAAILRDEALDAAARCSLACGDTDTASGYAHQLKSITGSEQACASGALVVDCLNAAGLPAVDEAVAAGAAASAEQIPSYMRLARALIARCSGDDMLAAAAVVHRCRRSTKALAASGGTLSAVKACSFEETLDKLEMQIGLLDCSSADMETALTAILSNTSLADTNTST